MINGQWKEILKPNGDDSNPPLMMMMMISTIQIVFLFFLNTNFDRFVAFGNKGRTYMGLVVFQCM